MPTPTTSAWLDHWPAAARECTEGESARRPTCLALGLLLIDHPVVQDERPVIVLTPTGYQAKCFISLEDSSRLLAHAEQLVKNLKIYRSRASEWGEQMDFFVGTELPEDLRRLGFVDPK